MFPNERRDISHLDHGFSELLKKLFIIFRIQLHQLPCFLTIGEQDLVGAEKTLVCHEILEVVVVEFGRSHKIQRKEILVSARFRTALSQPFLGVVFVESVVRFAVACLVVESLSETSAP